MPMRSNAAVCVVPVNLSKLNRKRRVIFFSVSIRSTLGSLDRRAQQQRSRQHFEAEVTAGKASLDVIKHPLYPYQQEGMLHLAFTGRALLADEMGLGKTVQAVAACELLRRTLGIRRVLVISPASLKSEWEEQIAKFTDLTTQIIQGPRAYACGCGEGLAGLDPLAGAQRRDTDRSGVNRLSADTNKPAAS
jgi:SNF2 family DNA or RNA helicase